MSHNNALPYSGTGEAPNAQSKANAAARHLNYIAANIRLTTENEKDRIASLNNPLSVTAADETAAKAAAKTAKSAAKGGKSRRKHSRKSKRKSKRKYNRKSCRKLF